MNRQHRKQGAKALAKLLMESDQWICVRVRNNKLQVDLPSEDAILLLSTLFLQSPEAFDMVTSGMEELRKEFAQ